MSLTDRILPGDARDATPLQNNFNGLDTLTTAIDKRRVRSGSFDAYHLASTAGAYWKQLDSALAAGPTAAPAAGTNLVSISNLPCEVGEAVFVRAHLQVDATGAGHETTLGIAVDAGGRNGVRTVQFDSGESDHITLIWAFVATSTTHTLHLQAGTHTNDSLTNMRIEAMAVRR
jgi:hypothetical protein